MFYKLLRINDIPLPCTAIIGDWDYQVVRGGLLLEPPQIASFGYAAEGHASLKFFGETEPGTSDFLGSSSEAYRWPGPGVLDISRRHETVGARYGRP
jgi:hypothetical protein